MLPDLPSGVGMVSSLVKFEILNRELQVIGQVSPERQPVVQNNTNSTVKRTLRNFQLREHEARDINLFEDRVRPVWTYEDGSEYRMGVFLFTSDDERIKRIHRVLCKLDRSGKG